MERGAIVFGWVYAAHMIGGAAAATASGVMRATTGDYLSAWITAGVLALAAAVACLAIPRFAQPAGSSGPVLSGQH